MSSNYLIIGVLLVVGAVIGFFHVDDNAVDEASYGEVVDLVNTLISLDKEVNELVIKSRFGMERNYDKLTDVSIEVHEVMEKINAIFARKDTVIKRRDITNYWADYINSVTLKLDNIEEFKSNNSVLRTSVNYAFVVAEKAAILAEQQDFLFLRKSLINSSNLLHTYVINRSRRELADLKISSIDIASSVQQVEDKTLQRSISEYLNHMNVILTKQQIADRYMVNIVNQDSHETLLNIAQAYNKHYLWETSKTKPIKSAAAFASYALVTMSILYLLWRLIDRKVRRPTEIMAQ